MSGQYFYGLSGRWRRAAAARSLAGSAIDLREILANRRLAPMPESMRDQLAAIMDQYEAS